VGDIAGQGDLEAIFDREQLDPLNETAQKVTRIRIFHKLIGQESQTVLLGQIGLPTQTGGDIECQETYLNVVRSNPARCLSLRIQRYDIVNSDGPHSWHFGKNDLSANWQV
jgi:hypothetical protein